MSNAYSCGSIWSVGFPLILLACEDGHIADTVQYWGDFWEDNERVNVLLMKRDFFAVGMLDCFCCKGLTFFYF